MAGVEVLYAQDPLKNRYNNHRSSFNNRRYTAVKSNQSSISTAQNRRKRSPPTKYGGAPMAGQVRITKRGESLAEHYAGSAFFMSPPPSSLPVPAFFAKKAVPTAVVNDGATSDLRRILKLDL